MVSLAQIVASAGLGAFIGYFTNALAIRSLFRPLEPHWYTLGWQGVIPKNRARLADNVATVVGEDLLYREYLVEQIERPALQESLRQLLGGRIGRLFDESPAGVLAWLPAVEVEPLVERVLALWQRGVGRRPRWGRKRPCWMSWNGSSALCSWESSWRRRRLRHWSGCWTGC